MSASLPHAPDLLQVARRVVWFKTPTEALAERRHFLAHVMTYGTIEDLRTVLRHVDEASIKDVLNNPPAGVFDPRSWAYWNTRYGRLPVPPMPTRRLEPASTDIPR